MPIHPEHPDVSQPNRIVPVYTWQSAAQQDRLFSRDRDWCENKFGRLANSFYQIPADSYGRESIMATLALMTVLKGSFSDYTDRPREHNFLKPVVYHFIDRNARKIALSRIMFRGLDRTALDDTLPYAIHKTNLALTDLHSDLRLEVPQAPNLEPATHEQA